MIVWLTCTHGRYRCLQRNLRCYLDQDFKGESVMFICNTGTPLKLGDIELSSNKHVYLDNATFMGFKSVGEKYNHALKLVMHLYPQATVITSADDDDIFLPNHLSQGSLGLVKAHVNKKMAYKPQQSYFRARDKEGNVTIHKVENTLEPSIFVPINWVKEKGYAEVSVKYHQQWLDPLIDNDMLFIDKEGVSTLIYNWGDNGGPDSWGIYKMSGSGKDDTHNYISHLVHSKDMGEGNENTLYPSDNNEQYYNLVKEI